MKQTKKTILKKLWVKFLEGSQKKLWKEPVKALVEESKKEVLKNPWRVILKKNLEITQKQFP